MTSQRKQGPTVVKTAGNEFRFIREEQGDSVYWRVEVMLVDMTRTPYWSPFWFVCESDFRSEGRSQSMTYDLICGLFSIAQGGK